MASPAMALNRRGFITWYFGGIWHMAAMLGTTTSAVDLACWGRGLRVSVRYNSVYCSHFGSLVGTISRKTSDSTDKCNGQNLVDIAVTNALELIRGQNFEN
jgi:hypothetical protein